METQEDEQIKQLVISKKENARQKKKKQDQNKIFYKNRIKRLEEKQPLLIDSQILPQIQSQDFQQLDTKEDTDTAQEHKDENAMVIQLDKEQSNSNIIGQQVENNDHQDHKINEIIQQTNQQLEDSINEFFSNKTKESYLKCIDFCLENKLLRNPYCINCKNLMRLSELNSSSHHKLWRCNDISCDKRKVGLFKGNPIFESFNMQLPQILHGITILVPNLTSLSLIVKTSTWSLHQLTKLREIYENLVQIYFNQIYNSEFTKLGENGSVVEMDESMFKRKYHAGRLNNRSWVFGICERGSKWDRTLFFPVSDRSSQTLIPLVKQYVSKNCAFICTDKWKAYNQLKEEGYEHETDIQLIPKPLNPDGGS
ncbi:hypothetical protein ABPG72_020021 [Tetrahymena utriculariae]